MRDPFEDERQMAELLHPLPNAANPEGSTFPSPNISADWLVVFDLPHLTELCRVPRPVFVSALWPIKAAMTSSCRTVLLLSVPPLRMRDL